MSSSRCSAAAEWERSTSPVTHVSAPGGHQNCRPGRSGGGRTRRCFARPGTRPCCPIRASAPCTRSASSEAGGSSSWRTSRARRSGDRGSTGPCRGRGAAARADRRRARPRAPRGVVHRDLKSANVMGRGGQAKVLDFGLARWLPDAEARRHGVVRHRDPRACRDARLHGARGAAGGTADARSDIWSLGVLLHEMAGGTPPFRGRRPSRPPRRSCRAPAAVPTGPARPPAGDRAVPVEREPARRYQCAADVREALDALERRRRTAAHRLGWRSSGRLAALRRRGEVAAAMATLAPRCRRLVGPLAGARAPMRRRAVMPLAPPRRRPQPYFADGLTEALIAEIGGPESSRHRADERDGSGGRRGTPGIARGTPGRRHPRRDGQPDGRVRLSVRLLEAATGHEVWSTSRERPASEAAALVASIAPPLPAGCTARCRTGGRQATSAVRAVRPDVQEAYLKGRYEWNLRTEASLRRAIDYYQSAVRMDPTYAPAKPRWPTATTNSAPSWSAPARRPGSGRWPPRQPSRRSRSTAPVGGARDARLHQALRVAVARERA